MSAVKTLIVWENLETLRFELKNCTTGEITTKYLTPDQAKDASQFHDKTTGTELEAVDRKQMVEWFAENYKKWGAKIEFITDKSQEGSQFCKGFGGVGGILRWRVDFVEMEAYDEDYSDGSVSGDDY